MNTIEDVRCALFDAYMRYKQVFGGIEGKSAEGYCELMYPTIWDSKTKTDFCKPIGIMIYSYTLDQSRNHYIWQSEKDYQENYYTWHAKNIYDTAVNIIMQWEEAINE